jgi:Zn ribbon nucleic-acid-binding protein
MLKMAEKKVFMDSQNMATFVCPECQKAKTIDVSQYKDIDKAVRVKCRCACGHSYTVLLERRKFYRKEADLPGIYNLPAKKRKGNMLVKNLSRNGLKLELTRPESFKIGDKLVVEFRLNDSKKTLITQEVVVRSIEGKYIGTEFCSMNPTDPANKALAFYLF